MSRRGQWNSKYGNLGEKYDKNTFLSRKQNAQDITKAGELWNQGKQGNPFGEFNSNAKPLGLGQVTYNDPESPAASISQFTNVLQNVNLGFGSSAQRNAAKGATAVNQVNNAIQGTTSDYMSTPMKSNVLGNVNFSDRGSTIARQVGASVTPDESISELLKQPINTRDTLKTINKTNNMGGNSMSPVQGNLITSGAAMAAGGMTDMVMSMMGGGQRRAEQAAANQEFNRMKMQFSQQDTSNPYDNLQNPFEDLTVNQQQAQFEAQQQQQGLANTMGALQGAAGGSGIAGLAQAMANQQSTNLQRASASIGQQEYRNQQMQAQGGMQIQMANRQGEVMSRQMENERVGTLFGMSQQRKAAADEAREKATRGLVGGVFETAAGVGMAAVGM